MGSSVDDTYVADVKKKINSICLSGTIIQFTDIHIQGKT